MNINALVSTFCASCTAAPGKTNEQGPYTLVLSTMDLGAGMLGHIQSIHCANCFEAMQRIGDNPDPLMKLLSSDLTIVASRPFVPPYAEGDVVTTAPAPA